MNSGQNDVNTYKKFKMALLQSSSMLEDMTEQEFRQEFFEYVDSEYGRLIRSLYKVCPYIMDFDGEDLRYKQAFTWFSFDRKNDAGRTLLDEFIDKFVADPVLESKARRLKEITHDTFMVERDADAKGTIVASARSSGRMYRIAILNNPDQFLKGRHFDGRICPSFKDGIYSTMGILVMHIPE